ncbi:MAG: GNAT family N-acetyltransferase [Clostridiales bacterium]|nr:GNAT family N-acetyltransferase [Clostridiales bacterium]
MLEIKQVINNKQLKTFVSYVNKLYKDNKYFVPDLVIDEVNTLRKDKNPAYDFSDGVFYLAYRNKKIVGRIGILVNNKSNEKWKQKYARFSHFDFIDDYEVSKTLMDTAIKWAKSKGLDTIHGPLGLTDMDHQGMLVEGFSELDLFITIYNHPYYKVHLEKLGFTKEIDWVEYQITIPKEPVKKYDSISKIVKKKYGYQLIDFTRKKDILPWAHKVFDLYNEAYAPLYGTTELSKKQIDMYVNAFFGFINPDFIKIVLDKNDKLIGFCITMPSLSKAMQKGKGKLFPFGFLHLLKSIKKNDILDLYLVAVLPEVQGTGAASLLIESIMNTAIKYGMTLAETGPELENNHMVRTMWKYFDTKTHRRRRIYIKSIK